MTISVRSESQMAFVLKRIEDGMAIGKLQLV